MKHLIQNGEGIDTLQSGEIVQIRYTLHANGQELSSNQDSEHCFEFELANGIFMIPSGLSVPAVCSTLVTNQQSPGSGAE
jgi:hypothetical protein